MPLFALNNFTCERDEIPLFNPINLEIDEGDIIQVAGPNGAGKTTLLRAICGLFSDYKGKMSWRNEPMPRPNYDFYDHVLYLGHQPGVKKSLTARENLSWFFGVEGKAVPVKVENALQEVGLRGYEDIPCQQMSAGQMRRVALAKLYITQSPFWVLDEPFTAIDVNGVAKLEGLIQAHAKKGGTVILTTHQALSIQNFRTIDLERFSGETYE